MMDKGKAVAETMTISMEQQEIDHPQKDEPTLPEILPTSSSATTWCEKVPDKAQCLISSATQ